MEANIDLGTNAPTAAGVPTPQAPRNRGGRPKLSLEQKQAYMRERLGPTIESTIVAGIAGAVGEDRKAITAALTVAVLTAIEQQEAILKADSSLEERTAASTRLFSLFQMCLKAEHRMSQMALRHDEINKRTMELAARKAKHKAISDSVVIVGMRERRKAGKILAKLERQRKNQLKYNQELQTLERQLAVLPKTEHVARLQLKQEMTRLRNKLRAGR